MKYKGSLTLNFTLFEIVWLAKTIGYVRIPFLNFVDKNQDDAMIRSELDVAKCQLLERELIYFSKKASWSIDRLLLVLMELIANPPQILTMRLVSRDGSTRNARVYRGQEFSLLVVETDGWEFTVYESFDELLGQVRNIVDMPAVSKATGTPIFLKNFESMSYGTWINPGVVTGFGLRRLASADTVLGMDFLTAAENMVVLSEFKSEDGDLYLKNSRYFFWNKECVWTGILQGDGTMEVVPSSFDAAFDYVRPMKTI